MNLLKVLTIVIAVFFSTEQLPAQERQPVEYVNPYIGTDRSVHRTVWETNGATFPGVLAPFGMVQITPDNYVYTNNKIHSFSILDHHSGWTSKGNFNVMVSSDSGNPASVAKPSTFRHATEKTTPYYYRVLLEDANINAEYTATQRVAYFRFSFPVPATAKISFSGITAIRLVDSLTMEGKCNGYYFIAKFNTPYKTAVNADNGAVVLHYATTYAKKIDIRIGFSTSSAQAAESNLHTESPDWDFSTLIAKNKKIWNDILANIELKGGTQDQRTIFYTALYHSFFMPCILSDADAPIARYTGLFPWDTYRSKHPLFAIIDPVRQGEMISSELAISDQTGWLPTGNMMGNHNIEMITDAYAKGIRNFDTSKALKVMRKSLLQSPYARREMTDFNDHGYVPAEVTSSVTHSLEFAYNDWALAEYIRITGNKPNYKNEYDTLLKRAKYYENLYAPNEGFMTAKSRSGEWAKEGYCEGTEWTYSWYVPHDVQGLINLMGGRRKFTDKLTECFEKGYYVHDNEPPLHYAYLFNYSGEPWKSQLWSRKILTENYSNTPGGIPGNDDLGALSSWFVLSAMGFYPVSPGTPIYEIGSPLFEEVIIHLSNGKSFTIKASNNNAKNPYIQSATINGRPLNQPWISHEAITNGSNIHFTMGHLPNKKWGSKPTDAPPSMTSGKPAFTFRKFSTQTNKTNPNQPFNLSVTLQNTGTASGTAAVKIIVDGKLWKTEYEIMQAGETKEVTYPVTLYQSGYHNITINSLPARQFIVSNAPPKFIYSKLTAVQPSIVSVKDSTTISATVKNIGGKTGEAAVSWLINDSVAVQYLLTLLPGAEKEVSFLFSQDHDGLFRVALGNLQPINIRVLDPVHKYPVQLPANAKAVLSYNFDDGPTGTVRNLAGPNNNALVIGNVKWVPALFGLAIQTNALDDAYLEIPANAQLDSISNKKTLTMMCWIYPMEEENFADIFAKGTSNTLQIKGGNTVLNFYTGGWEGHEATVVVPENWNRHWHHIAGVTENGFHKLYLDGNLVATKKDEPKNPKGETAIHPPINVPWNLGRNAAVPDRIFKGFIDDILLFETALTKDQIFSIMMHL